MLVHLQTLNHQIQMIQKLMLSLKLKKQIKTVSQTYIIYFINIKIIQKAKHLHINQRRKEMTLNLIQMNQKTLKSNQNILVTQARKREDLMQIKLNLRPKKMMQMKKILKQRKKIKLSLQLSQNILHIHHTRKRRPKSQKQQDQMSLIQKMLSQSQKFHLTRNLPKRRKNQKQ